MMDTAADDLINLREQILEQTVPLLESDTIPVNERFQLTLQLARTKGTLDLYQQAFRLAQAIDENDKFNAYYDLLAAVDAKIEENTDFSGEDETPAISEDGNNHDSENHGEGQ